MKLVHAYTVKNRYSNTLITNPGLQQSQLHSSYFKIINWSSTMNLCFNIIMFYFKDQPNLLVYIVWISRCCSWMMSVLDLGRYVRVPLTSMSTVRQDRTGCAGVYRCRSSISPRGRFCKNQNKITLMSQNHSSITNNFVLDKKVIYTYIPCTMYCIK